jgi:hypothetical protein
MNRPTGVTIIAILQFIGAGLCILAGIGALVGASFLGAAGGPAGAGGMFAMLGGAVSIVLFIIAGIAILLGWGLWTLKEWARIVTIVLQGLALLGAVLTLVQLGSAFLVGGIIRLAISGLIIWYLLKPDVKAAFQGQSRAAGA